MEALRDGYVVFHKDPVAPCVFSASVGGARARRLTMNRAVSHMRDDDDDDDDDEVLP